MEGWSRQSAAGRHPIIATLAVVALCFGCGKSGPALYPVVGKVTLDGKAVTEGGVVFHDQADAMRQYVGGIKSDGTYSLMYNREQGAPAGKYRVTVFVTETPTDANGQPVDLPKTLSHPKFMDPKSTPLSVEVKEAAPAGAYDLAVTR